jgi:hypothetical protein
MNIGYADLVLKKRVSDIFINLRYNYSLRIMALNQITGATALRQYSPCIGTFREGEWIDCILVDRTYIHVEIAEIAASWASSRPFPCCEMISWTRSNFSASKDRVFQLTPPTLSNWCTMSTVYGFLCSPGSAR